MLKVAAPPAWRSRATVAAGVRLARLEAGSADPLAPRVVLLHGLGHWSEAAWDRLVPALDPRFRYVAFDLPGFGSSEKPRAAYDLAYFRAVVGAALDGEGDAPLRLVGHSLGGLIAADYAGAHPERIARLALVAPAGFAHPLRHALYAVACAVARGIVTRRPPAGLVRRILRRAVVDPAQLDPAVVARAVALSADGGLRAAFAGVYAAALAALLRGAPLRARFARYRGPVLCAWGAHDRYLDVAGLAAVRRVYPAATTLVLERSGHLPMVEEPATLAAALRVFLA